MLAFQPIIADSDLPEFSLQNEAQTPDFEKMPKKGGGAGGRSNRHFGCRLEYVTQARIPNPLSFTRFSSFKEGPLGLFWPLSHF